MDGRNELDRGMRGVGRGECVRLGNQPGERRGMGLSGIPWGGGRGRCRGGNTVCARPDETRRPSSPVSLLEDLASRIDALEQRLSGDHQNRETNREPQAP
jgi:hypothetical protein